MVQLGSSTIEIRTVRPPPAEDPTKNSALLETERLSLYYGEVQALKDITMAIRERMVTAFIGPSGCGKSTLLRCFNRLNDLIEGVRMDGTVRIAGQDIYSRQWTSSSCANGWAWSSRNPIRSPNPFTKTSPTACVCTASATKKAG
jgi:ABC-type phosphate transport system ATPase subunit